ncbi:hypothetical protein PISMIDRAFT_690063, partial [Pisolithus microcarpus 441]
MGVPYLWRTALPADDIVQTEGVSLKAHPHAREGGSGYDTELGVFSSVRGFLPIMGLLEAL